MTANTAEVRSVKARRTVWENTRRTLATAQGQRDGHAHHLLDVALLRRGGHRHRLAWSSALWSDWT